MFKRFLAILTCIALCATLFTACTPKSENTKLTVVLDWTPNTNHTGLYAAMDLGYYSAEGLDIEIIQPPEDGALSLVAAGRADFAVSFEEEVVVAANADNPLPIVAIAALVEHNTGGILSLKESGITSFKEMEGKKFGSWQIPIYDEIIRESIIADGGDPSKVDFVPNQSTDAVSGLRHEFDAVWVYEGWEKIIADIEGAQTNFFRLTDATTVFDYYTPVLVCGKDMLQKKRELVTKFLTATEKGYTYAKENPTAAADILLKHTPETDSKIIYASQEFLSTQYFSEKWGYIDEKRWNAFFDWLKEKDLIGKDANERAFENVLK